MADEPAARNSTKPKRRLRPAPTKETMRERAEKSARKLEAEQQKATRKLAAPKPAEPSKPPRKPSASFRAIWRPISWLGRHIIPGYFKGAFRELRATTWPNRKQSRQLTSAVIIFAIIFSAFVSALDYGLDKLFKELIVK